jgi:hypothetical protein
MREGSVSKTKMMTTTAPFICRFKVVQVQGGKSTSTSG